MVPPRMARPVNSFDVFDTLISRRCGDPRQIFAKLATRSKLPILKSLRPDADRLLGAYGRPYTLEDIWREVGRTGGLDRDAVERHMALEVQIEHEEVIPVTENLAQVRDGDLLISDTYLPAEVVRSLLEKVGFDKQVGLVVTNDGKFRGWIWPKLLAALKIERHLGDNEHSDGRTPSAAGIESIIYTGSRPSPVEMLLAEHGWGNMASVSREVRLANPFSDSAPAQRHLWAAACQLNFPLLILASLRLEQHARETGAGELFFVSRDCLMWWKLHQRLFPARRTRYLYASRLCLLDPSPDFIEYFRSVWRPDGLIVDLFSTGTSWSFLFRRLGALGRCFFIGRVDNTYYLPAAAPAADELSIQSVCRTSEFGSPLSKSLELLNYATHGSVEDVKMLAGTAPMPILADPLEYDVALPRAAHQAFDACLRSLNYHTDLFNGAAEHVSELIQAFVRMICADPQLTLIYPGHLAADIAYEQRILETLDREPPVS